MGRGEIGSPTGWLSELQLPYKWWQVLASAHTSSISVFKAVVTNCVFLDLVGIGVESLEMLFKELSSDAILQFERFKDSFVTQDPFSIIFQEHPTGVPSSCPSGSWMDSCLDPGKPGHWMDAEEEFRGLRKHLHQPGGTKLAQPSRMPAAVPHEGNGQSLGGARSTHSPGSLELGFQMSLFRCSPPWQLSVWVVGNQDKEAAVLQGPCSGRAGELSVVLTATPRYYILPASALLSCLFT